MNQEANKKEIYDLRTKLLDALRGFEIKTHLSVRSVRISTLEDDNLTHLTGLPYSMVEDVTLDIELRG